MKKYAVFSGFLGSGKTTAMMALTKHCTEHYAKCAMISNDLGSQSLADNKLAVLSGCNASELISECICYQTENLIARLDSLYDDGCELVISDIPGFGVGALDHVYHTLHNRFPDRCTLAPFTVLVEPHTIAILQSGTGGDLEYILKTQLVEADLIVLNKCDLISPDGRDAAREYLLRTFPHAEVITISAATGEGLDELTRALLERDASMRLPDIGYGGPAFGNAMGRISEFYMQYFATVCCDDFDANSYLADVAEHVRSSAAAEKYDIPHLKLLAWTPEGDYGKADLIGIDRPIEIPHRFKNSCTQIAVMLNASAVCPGSELDRIITAAVDEISPSFNLETVIFQKECFGMTD